MNRELVRTLNKLCAIEGFPQLPRQIYPNKQKYFVKDTWGRYIQLPEQLVSIEICFWVLDKLIPAVFTLTGKTYDVTSNFNYETKETTWFMVVGGYISGDPFATITEAVLGLVDLIAKENLADSVVN